MSQGITLIPTVEWIMGKRTLWESLLEVYAYITDHVYVGERFSISIFIYRYPGYGQAESGSAL